MPIGSRCRADEKKSHHFLSFWPPAVLALNGAERRNKKIARDCRLNFRSRRFHFRSLYIGTARRPGPFDRCSLLSHQGSSHHIFLLIASIDRCSAPCRVHVIFRCSRSNRSTEPVSNKFHDQIVRTSKLCARRVCLRHEFALHRGTGERESHSLYLYYVQRDTQPSSPLSLYIYLYIAQQQQPFEGDLAHGSRPMYLKCTSSTVSLFLRRSGISSATRITASRSSQTDP